MQQNWNSAVAIALRMNVDNQGRIQTEWMRRDHQKAMPHVKEMLKITGEM